MIEKIKAGQGWFERMCKIVDKKRKDRRIQKFE